MDEKNIEEKAIEAKREADVEYRRKVQRQSMGITFVLAAAVVIYAVYGIAVKKSITPLIFEILLGMFIVVYTLMTDVVEPWRLGMLSDMTVGQREAFMKIIVADVVGVGALMFWIVRMDSDSGNDFLMPALIYFLSIQMKRKFRPEFEGIVEEEEKTGREE